MATKAKDLVSLARITLVKRLIDGNESKQTDSKREIMETGKAEAQKRRKITLFTRKADNDMRIERNTEHAEAT